MMEEQIVNFETAKLAKNKGFTMPKNPFGYVTKFYRPSTKTLLSYGRTGRSKIKDLIYAPSQSLLQKWLREKHDKHIIIIYIRSTKEYDVFYSKDSGVSEYSCNSYEEALEVGLLGALNLIKNED